MDLVAKYADRDAGILDVGGAASVLVDHLLGDGYAHVSVLDMSAEALRVAQARLDSRSAEVNWIVEDITTHPVWVRSACGMTGRFWTS